MKIKEIYYKEDNDNTRAKIKEVRKNYNVKIKKENIEMNWIKITIEYERERKNDINNVMNR